MRSHSKTKIVVYILQKQVKLICMKIMQKNEFLIEIFISLAQQKCAFLNEFPCESNI